MSELAKKASKLVLLLIWINVLAYPIHLLVKWAENRGNPVSRKYGMTMTQYYPGLSEQDVQELLDVTWDLAPRHQAFSGRSVAPISTRFVNVSPQGFRMGKEQKAWPPDRERQFVVFLLGGSTAFGFGVPDDDTIGSHLQEILAARAPGEDVAVYNFGVPAHQSTLERIQLEQMLVGGLLPDVAVFLDGYNDCNASHEPLGTPMVAEVLDSNAFSSPSWLLWRAAKQLPLSRLLSRFSHAVGFRSSPKDPEPPAHQVVIERYRRNLRIIVAAAKSFGVAPVLVWQPVPDYGYDPKLHAFADLTRPENRPREKVYQEMAGLWRAGVLGADFAWCADLNEGATEPLYVDIAHYSGRMSRRIAECVATAMSAVPRASGLEDSVEVPLPKTAVSESPVEAGPRR